MSVPEYLKNILEYNQKIVNLIKKFPLNGYEKVPEKALKYWIEKKIDKIEEYFFNNDKSTIINFYQYSKYFYIKILIKEYFKYSFNKRGEKAFNKLIVNIQ